MPSIAAVVLGGTSILGGPRSYLGTVAGVILITLLQSILSVMQMPEAGRQIIYGVVIVAMLLLYGRARQAADSGRKAVQAPTGAPGSVPAIVVMGVAGCGKSAASASRWPPHWALPLSRATAASSENVARMASGGALTDKLREGWPDAIGEHPAS